MPVYNLCRICLTEDTNTEAMQPLFDENNDECAEIVKQIEECGGITLKPHAEFPKNICFQCLESLDTSYKFRVLCQASESSLLNAIVKSEMKTEPQEEYQSQKNANKCSGAKDMPVFLEFINAREVEFTEITEAEENTLTFTAAVDENFDYEAATCPESDDVTSSVEVKRKRRDRKKGRGVKVTKSKVSKMPGKRGRPRLNDAPAILCRTPGMRSIKPNRGRKRLDTEQTIMCEICGNIYTKRNLLKMHMRRHLAEKPFECEICNKTFSCPSEVGRHMRTHTGEKPYVCKFCGRTFADRSTHIKHERIHTNERPFSCQTCGKSFTYSNVLKNHMLTHTGEKPFPCLPCHKTFSRKHQLDQHLATLTHKQTVKRFTYLDSLVEMQDTPVLNVKPEQSVSEANAQDI